MTRNGRRRELEVLEHVANGPGNKEIAQAIESYLAQARWLTKTGSTWWSPATGDFVWFEENYRIMGYPIGVTPTTERSWDRRGVRLH